MIKTAPARTRSKPSLRAADSTDVLPSDPREAEVEKLAQGLIAGGISRVKAYEAALLACRSTNGASVPPSYHLAITRQDVYVDESKGEDAMGASSKAKKSRKRNHDTRKDMPSGNGFAAIVGRGLARHRLGVSMSAPEFAAKRKINQTLLYRLESGAYPQTTGRKLDYVLARIGISLIDLLQLGTPEPDANEKK